MIDERILLIGKRIKAARLKLGLTQAELGATIGANQRTIWEIETGRYRQIGMIIKAHNAVGLHLTSVTPCRVPAIEAYFEAEE